MDLNRALEVGQLINATYAILPNNLNNAAGQVVNVGGASYTVVTTIYASDLATDMDPARGGVQVSIGLVLLGTQTGDVVVAIRGTEGILEWIHDAEFNWVLCPFLAGAGQTEDGFTDMYVSLRTALAVGSPSVSSALATLPFSQPVNSVTVAGHSLGGALATLLALDLAANTTFKLPIVYTFGCPRTGDPLFVSTYDQVVPNTLRIANRADLVPKLPFPPFYDHVKTPFDLNAIQLVPPKLLVKPTIPCEHAMNTYLHLLSVVAQVPVLPLEGDCVP